MGPLPRIFPVLVLGRTVVKNKGASLQLDEGTGWNKSETSVFQSFKVKGTFKLSNFHPFSSHDARARTLYIVKVTDAPIFPAIPKSQSFSSSQSHSFRPLIVPLRNSSCNI
jgi:hypothetical protein